MEKLNLPGYIKPDLFNIKYKQHKSGEDIIEAIILAYDLEDAISGFYNKISKEDISTILSVTNLSENTNFIYTKNGYDILGGKEWYIFDMKIDKEIVKDFEYNEKDNTIKEKFSKYIEEQSNNIKSSISEYCARKITEPEIDGEELYFSKAVAKETFKPIFYIQKLKRVITDTDKYCEATYYSIEVDEFHNNFESTTYVDFRTKILKLANVIPPVEIGYWTPLYSLYIFS